MLTKTTFLLVPAVLIGSVLSNQASAALERVLYAFTGFPNGQTPVAGLVFDSAGDVYGTAPCCGSDNGGVVFELLPGAGGTWSEKVLYNFGFASTDGSDPQAAPVFDSIGNLYGTTYHGGNWPSCFGYGCGTVYELSPNSDGTWAETVLYRFGGDTDGYWPASSLVFDNAGNLYGTTQLGGAFGLGTIFELSPDAGGGWQKTTLFSFAGSPDGTEPRDGLTIDAEGNLYGTTLYGGSSPKCIGGCGTAFQLRQGLDGTWTETVIHSFGFGRDGVEPWSGLALDSSSNLYGTTLGGGAGSCSGGCGTVYRLSPFGEQWVESVMYRFAGGLSDGWAPYGRPILDQSGNLYGTTVLGGSNKCLGNGCGIAWELRRSGGTATEITLYTFQAGHDGSNPEAGLTFGPNKSLYGTTETGGGGPEGGAGVIFQIRP